MKIAGVRVYCGRAIMTISKGEPRERKTTVAEQRRIDKCLNCTKPAKECKGDCK